MIYAIRKGKMVGIDDVENGLKCNCVCPHCKAPLVARHGDKNDHCFAHHVEQSKANEKACNEHYNHWLLKNLFAGFDYLNLPAHENKPKFTKLLDPEKAIVEKPMKGFRPDVVLVGIDGSLLIVEIINWNKISNKKKKLIKDSSIDCVEVDAFGWLDYPAHISNINKIQSRLKDDPSIKRWVFNKLAELNIEVKITNNFAGSVKSLTRRSNEGGIEFFDPSIRSNTSRPQREVIPKMTDEIYHTIESWRFSENQNNIAIGIIRSNDAKLKHKIRNGCKCNECPIKKDNCWSCEHFNGFTKVISEEHFFCLV